jgi:uncharacterized protein (TIGR03067 family)
MKRIRISLVLACSAGAFLLALQAISGAPARANDDKAERDKKELAALQGTWKLIFHEEEGKEVSDDAGQLYTIEQQKITVKRGNEVVVEGDLKLDASANPPHLDWAYTSGTNELTIYIRAGNLLIQCGHRDGKTRPKEFASGTADGGAYLIVLKREK